FIRLIATRNSVKSMSTANDEPSAAANVVESDVDSCNGSDEKSKPIGPTIIGPKTNRNGHKGGVIYLSQIPTGLNVARLTEILGKHGRLGRTFLQPASAATYYIVFFFLKMY